jgi:hypothetical protein
VEELPDSPFVQVEQKPLKKLGVIVQKDMDISDNTKGHRRHLNESFTILCNNSEIHWPCLDGIG